jgi:hypothetical protein
VEITPLPKALRLRKSGRLLYWVRSYSSPIAFFLKKSRIPTNDRISSWRCLTCQDFISRNDNGRESIEGQNFWRAWQINHSKGEAVHVALSFLCYIETPLRYWRGQIWPCCSLFEFQDLGHSNKQRSNNTCVPDGLLTRVVGRCLPISAHFPVDRLAIIMKSASHWKYQTVHWNVWWRYLTWILLGLTYNNESKILELLSDQKFSKYLSQFDGISLGMQLLCRCLGVRFTY